jgi:hypothetical protein
MHVDRLEPGSNPQELYVQKCRLAFNPETFSLLGQAELAEPSPLKVEHDIVMITPPVLSVLLPSGWLVARLPKIGEQWVVQSISNTTCNTNIVGHYGSPPPGHRHFCPRLHIEGMEGPRNRLTCPGLDGWRGPQCGERRGTRGPARTGTFYCSA